jgi:alanyl-tRNA synthetase
VLRRLIRRAIREVDRLGIKEAILGEIAGGHEEEFRAEEMQFRKTLANGLRELEKMGNDIDAFMLFTTYGFPIELTEEIAKEKGFSIDIEKVRQQMAEHQALSRAGSEQKFKGGLADSAEQTVRYHTATHMLLAAIRKILGGEITQKGSNITAERLRFDFNWPEKLSQEQLKAIEDLVNEKIQDGIPVEMKELSKAEALKIVGILSFDLSKYGDVVKVYTIGDFSAEFCGGPHVTNTAELGHFKILKEEASSAGVRRIKAVLE